jgi:hypothetical protein
MNPGNELDNLVAENVMGWIRVPPGHELAGFWQTPDGDYRKGYEDLGGYWSDTPPFSQSISAAWEVVNNFPAASFHLSKHPTIPKWEASFGIGFAKEERFSYMNGEGETPAHAICLAALRVIESTK